MLFDEFLICKSFVKVFEFMRSSVDVDESAFHLASSFGFKSYFKKVLLILIYLDHVGDNFVVAEENFVVTINNIIK